MVQMLARPFWPFMGETLLSQCFLPRRSLDQTNYHEKIVEN